MPHTLIAARLPRSGNAALASGALIQAAVGTEFVLAGLNKVINPSFPEQFASYVQGSPGSSSGLLAPLIQALVLPNVLIAAELARFTELFAGLVLVLTALEVIRRRLASPLGAPHAYEPLVALLSASSAFVLGGLSLTIYLIQGGQLPALNPGYSFSSPIPIELLLVPLAFAIGWLELGRYRALRTG